MNILILVGIARYVDAYPAYPVAPLYKYMWTFIVLMVYILSISL
jgi:hypothetical protein